MITNQELTDQLRARIVWSVITEPGDGIAGAIINKHGAVRAYEMIVNPDSVVPSGRLIELRERVAPRLHDGIVDEVMEVCARHGIEIITPYDPEWPMFLKDLTAWMPHVLYVRGDKDALAHSQAVSIVGARAATSYGEHITMQLASELSTDHTIVSGGAYGIDGAAHRGALAAGGVTIAYLAGGIDRMYPAGHNQLLQDVMQSGAVVSEVPPGSAPTKWRFLSRNRLIAAHSRVSLVVEAGARSGSLNEAGHARDLGRKVAAVPGPVTSVASVGTNRLIQEGAALVTCADDVRALTGAPRRAQ